MSRGLALALVLAAFGALALRLPYLDRRPMHNDEAINAAKIQGLWERGEFRYDPDEFHGPSLYYATLPFVWLSGARDFDHLSERTLRLATVAFGVMLIPLVWLLRDGLGRTPAAVAAGLMALSPAMVFYSRYFIHEMLLVCFTLVFLAGAWRYSQSKKAGWAALSGAGLGLMYATKETFVITLGAMGLALAMTIVWNWWRDQARFPWRNYWNARHFALALGVAAVVSLVLFTSFFTNLRGPVDSALTYFPWLRRAGGHSPHIHPWHFYLERLFWFHPARSPVWTEGVIAVLAVVGFASALANKGLGDTHITFARFLAFFTPTLTAAYSIISYKTPWCLLNFLLPMILLAGVGAMAMIRLVRWRPLQWAVGCLLAASGAHLGWEAWGVSGGFAHGRLPSWLPASLRGEAWSAAEGFAYDRRNPYVYAQTVPNVVELTERVKAIAAVSPQGVQTEVKVIAPESDFWPLPWYLRQMKAVWWLDRLPDNPYAPLMIVSASLQAALDEKSNKRYLSVGFYEMRPRVFFELYVEFELWKKFVETLPRPKDE